MKNDSSPLFFGAIVAIAVLAVAFWLIFFSPFTQGDGKTAKTADHKEGIAKIVTSLDEYFLSLADDGIDHQSQASLALMPWSETIGATSTTSQKIAGYAETRALGYAFKTPYGVATENAKTFGNDKVKQFSYAGGGGGGGGGLIATMNTQKASDEIAQLDDPEFLKTFEEYLGKDFESNYAFRYFLLTSTPEKVKTASTLMEAKARAQAVVLRDATLFGDASALYSFEKGEIRGFAQLFTDGGMVVEFFGPKDNWHSFVFRKGDKTLLDTIVMTLNME